MTRLEIIREWLGVLALVVSYFLHTIRYADKTAREHS